MEESVKGWIDLEDRKTQIQWKEYLLQSLSMNYNSDVSSPLNTTERLWIKMRRK